MNTKIAAHFGDRYDGLSPRIVEAFGPADGWLPVPEQTVDAFNLKRLDQRGFTMVGVSPVAGSQPTVADFSVRELLAADGASSGRIERKGRPALTSHQRDLFLRLSADRPRNIGSPSGMAHLVAKGYARRIVEHGPRGGEQFSYVAVP